MSHAGRFYVWLLYCITNINPLACILTPGSDLFHIYNAAAFDSLILAWLHDFYLRCAWLIYAFLEGYQWSVYSKIRTIVSRGKTFYFRRALSFIDYKSLRHQPAQNGLEQHAGSISTCSFQRYGDGYWLFRGVARISQRGVLNSADPFSANKNSSPKTTFSYFR